MEILNQMVSDRYGIYNGDSVEMIRGIPDNSIHYTMFSPPFASLYTYSNSDRDMGNCKDDKEFYNHFKFLAGELYRVTKPGRLLSFHCMDLPLMKSRDGVIGMKDFPAIVRQIFEDLAGELYRVTKPGRLLSFHCMDLPLMKSRDGVIGMKDFPAIVRQIFEDCGFIYHSRVTIWKNPVTEMQRTKALGLLHKQIKKDSSMSRQGMPDYIITMRKDGDNQEAITHTDESFPVEVWQNYASPVWMDIRQSDTLQKKSAREEDDERHICPLQLEAIQRCIELWTNPNDIVLDPFAGIGSVPYTAIKLGRRGIGFELKESYYKQAKNNLESALNEPEMNCPIGQMSIEDFLEVLPA